MTRDEFRAWLYENYNVGDRCYSMGPTLVDNILHYAGILSDEDMHTFLGEMFDDVPDEIIDSITF